MFHALGRNSLSLSNKTGSCASAKWVPPPQQQQMRRQLTVPVCWHPGAIKLANDLFP